jgi:hypothetical protein
VNVESGDPYEAGRELFLKGHEIQFDLGRYGA